MNVRHSKSGFTLIELLLGALALSILVLIVGTILIRSWVGWNNYTAGVGMQRDAMVAIRILEKEIRNSTIDEVSETAGGLDFTSITARDDDYTFRSSDIATMPGVSLLNWADPVIGSNFVTVAFTLQANGGVYEKEYTATVYPRNLP